MQSYKKIGAFLSKHPWLAGLGLFAVLIAVILPTAANAGFFDIAKDSVVDAVVWILTGILNMLGSLINIIIYFLVLVATYDNFATSPAVANGWVIMRDLANMAIVVGLLYIAFANALGKGKYSLDQALMRLVGVAILVNFSKTVTLMLVDVSQVVMLTFVNAFKDVGVGNFAQMMGVEKFGQLSDASGTGLGAMGGLIFNIIIMLIVMAVLIVMIGILVVRVVMIWLFIVIAPVAFIGIGSSVPFADKIWSQWWSKFQEYLLIGPCIAFFIWLTFTSLQSANTYGGGLGDQAKLAKIQSVTNAPDLGKVGTIDTLAGFVIAIAMLLGGVSLCAKMASGVPGVGGLKPSALKKGILTGLGGARDLVAGGGRRLITASGGIKSLGGGIKNAFRSPGETYNKMKLSGGGMLEKAKAYKAALPGRMKEGIKAMPAAAGKGLVSVFSGEAVGKGIGRAVAATKFVEEFVQEPGTLAKGMWRRFAKGEKGAVGTAIEKGRESALKNAKKDIETEGRSQDDSKAAIAGIKSGVRSDLTQPQRLAEFLAAIDNGALGSPKDKEDAWKAIKGQAKDAGQNMDFYAMQEKKWRKTAYESNSIYQKPLTMSENGEAVPRMDTLEKVFEKSEDMNSLTMWDKINNDETDFEKISPTYDDEDEVFQVQKASVLGIDEVTLAKSNDPASKAKYRANLEKLVKNANLTEVELNKAKQLLAASHVDGGALTGKSTEDIEKAIEDVVTNKSGKKDIKDSMDLATAGALGARLKVVADDAPESVANKIHKMLAERSKSETTSTEALKERNQKVDVIIQSAMASGDSDKDIQLKLKDNDPAFDLDEKTFKAAKTRVVVNLAQDEVMNAVPNTAGANIEESIKKAIADYVSKLDKTKVGVGASKEVGSANFELEIRNKFKSQFAAANTASLGTGDAMEKAIVDSIKTATDKAVADAAAAATAASAKSAADAAAKATVDAAAAAAAAAEKKRVDDAFKEL